MSDMNEEKKEKAAEAADPMNRVRRKLAVNCYDDHVAYGPAVIAAFGDSITHGCFRDDEFDYEAVYHAVLRRMLNHRYPYNPVNMIDAGIGGTTAAESVKRLERDVLCHHPDLVIVCFGLNDVNRELEDYEKAMRTILQEIRKTGAGVILLTPNMLNHRVDDTVVSQGLMEYAKITCTYQNRGKMDSFMHAARSIAGELSVPVCDFYAEWENMQNAGIDTDRFLINGINHPVREMHRKMAEMLFRMITGESAENE